MSIRDYWNLGFQLQKEKEYEKAIICFTKAIDLDPVEVDHYRFRADCYFEIGDFCKAQQDYKVVGRLSRPKKYEQLELIDELFDNGMFAESIQETLIMNDPDQLIRLGDKFAIVKRYDEAIRCYDLAINEKPTEAEYQRQREKYLAAAQNSPAVVMSDLHPKFLDEGTSRNPPYLDAPGQSRQENTNDNSRYYYDLGLRSRMDREYEKAIMYFTEAIDLNPFEAEYYRYRARCYLEMGDTHTAQEDYKTVGRLNPPNRSEQRARIEELFRSGMFDESIEETLIMNDPDQLVELGDKFATIEMYNEAIRCYDLAINEEPSRVHYYVRRIKCYTAVKIYPRAISDFRAALSLDPQCRSISIMDAFNITEYSPMLDPFLSLLRATERGILCKELYSSGRTEEALSCYNAAVQRYPEEIQFYLHRGQIYEHMERLDMAAQDIFTAAKKCSDMAAQNIFISTELESQIDLHHAHLGRILAKMDAFSPLTRETILPNLRATELQHLGHELFTNGKAEMAIYCCTEAIRRNSYWALSYMQRGNYFVQMGNWVSGISDIAQAITLDPNIQDYRNIFIQTLLTHFERFYEVSQEHLRCLTDVEIVQLGNIFVFQRKLGEALRCYNTAINERPTDAFYYALRGRCYSMMENWSLAITDFVRAWQLNPHNEEIRIRLVELLFQHVENLNEIPEVIRLGLLKPNCLLKETLLVLSDTELVRIASDFTTSRKFQNALHCYSILIRKNSSEAEYSRKGATSHIQMRDVHRAIIDLREALRLEPSSRSDRLTLSRLLFDIGKYTEAIEETQFVQENGDEMANLGDRFCQIEKFQEAFWCYTEAIKSNPRKHSYYKQRGLCYARTENLNEAVNDLKRAVELGQFVISNRLDLIRVLAKARRYTEAESVLENIGDQLLALNPLEVNELRRKVQEMKEEDRLDKLIDHLKGLIEEDSRNQIGEITKKTQSKEMGRISMNEMNEVLQKRDSYLKILTDKYERFKVIGIFLERDSTNTWMRDPKYFMDVITLELIEDAVIAPSGISYSRSPIFDYIQATSMEPSTRKHLKIDDLRPNLALREAIRHWKESQGRS